MCRVIGCLNGPGGGRRAASFTDLCNTHRQRERRHGDANQTPILVKHLRPYLRSLDRRQRANPDAKLWGLLTARWDALVDRCKETLKVSATGIPMNRWERQAALEIVRVAEEVAPEAAWRTAIAAFLLREHDPRIFASDNGFVVQLGRCVRHLAEMNVGSYWQPASGTTKRVYRDPNARVAVRVGEALAEVFGVAGLYFVEQERKEAERKDAERRAFYEALREVVPGE